MARKTAKAKPHPEPEMLTICADILQETDEAILIGCDGTEAWLPNWQDKDESTPPPVDPMPETESAQ